eukprot:SAG22_NODE_284_length_13033_cov_21.541828_2_plen_111_part_00
MDRRLTWSPGTTGANTAATPRESRRAAAASTGGQTQVAAEWHQDSLPLPTGRCTPARAMLADEQETADDLAELEADDGSDVQDELDADAAPGWAELADAAGEIFGFGECF